MGVIRLIKDYIRPFTSAFVTFTLNSAYGTLMIKICFVVSPPMELQNRCTNSIKRLNLKFEGLITIFKSSLFDKHTLKDVWKVFFFQMDSWSNLDWCCNLYIAFHFTFVFHYYLDNSALAALKISFDLVLPWVAGTLALGTAHRQCLWQTKKEATARVCSAN